MWTGSGDATRELFPPLDSLPPPDLPNENMCSAGVRLAYGRFARDPKGAHRDLSENANLAGIRAQHAARHDPPRSIQCRFGCTPGESVRYGVGGRLDFCKRRGRSAKTRRPTKRPQLEENRRGGLTIRPRSSPQG
jgi:hypothetical protein